MTDKVDWMGDAIRGLKAIGDSWADPPARW